MSDLNKRKGSHEHPNTLKFWEYWYLEIGSFNYAFVSFPDESGSDSDGADSTSSSYSSLSDFVTDMVNSEIDGDTPSMCPVISDMNTF